MFECVRACVRACVRVKEGFYRNVNGANFYRNRIIIFSYYDLLSNNNARGTLASSANLYNNST